ncbi:MAG: rRNA maturation RNase YbeY [Patescibacteria group bacterium]
MSVSIASSVKSYPRHNYAIMAEDILGKRYDVSLVFVGTKRAQSLNIQYRNKSYTPNVLSFPLSNEQGEIYICPSAAKAQAKDFTMSEREYIAFLFIHGCLHLKGHTHGATMEKAEQRYFKKYFRR